MRLGALVLSAAVSVCGPLAAQEAEPPAFVPATVPVTPDVQVDTTATVHVIAENIESDRGDVWLALCDSALTVDGCPYKLSVPAAAGFVDVTFENIPPGAYAVVGYHDVNGDAEFDSLLGVPREPYALSGAAGEMLVPTFDAAIVPIKAGSNDVVIRLKRLVG